MNYGTFKCNSRQLGIPRAHKGAECANKSGSCQGNAHRGICRGQSVEEGWGRVDTTPAVKHLHTSARCLSNRQQDLVIGRVWLIGGHLEVLGKHTLAFTYRDIACMARTATLLSYGQSICRNLNLSHVHHSGYT